MRTAMLFLTLTGFQAMAATIDMGPNGCTLQDAIRAANADAPRGQCSAGSGHDTIIAPDDWIVVLSGQLPTVDSDMTIRSQSAGGLLHISGDNDHPIMKVNGSNTDLTLQRVRLFNGEKNSAIAGGGAALNIDDATVTLLDCQFEFNSVKDARGGAINVRNGHLIAERCEFSDNEAQVAEVPFSSRGGALFAENTLLELSEVYFHDNSSDDEGDGLYVNGGTLYLEQSLVYETIDGVGGHDTTAHISNTTFAYPDPGYSHVSKLHFSDNSLVTLNHVTMSARMKIYDSVIEASNSIFVTDCFTTGSVWTVDTHNIFINSSCHGPSQPITLFALADNGGFTRTRALHYSNIAVDAGDPAYCLAEDQRGETRGAECDIGAYEVTDAADVRIEVNLLTPAPYVSNQTIDAQLVITNQGPGVANAIEVDLSGSQFFLQAVNSGLCSQLPCLINQLTAGQQIVLPFTASMGNHNFSPYSVTAEAHSTLASNHNDPDEHQPGQNNEDTATGAILAGADLSVDMDLITAGPYFIDQIITHRAIVHNAGQQTATNLNLAITPTGLTVLQFTGCNGTVGTVCQINGLGNGQSLQIDVQSKVTAASFNAAAQVNADQTDVNPGNNYDDTGNQGAVDDTDLAVSMSLNQSPPFYSDQFLSFEISVKTGDKAASNVRLWTEMPGGIYIGLGNCISIPCDLGTMPPFTQIDLTANMFAPIIGSNGQPSQWQHTVYVEAGQQDSSPGDNEVIMSGALNPAADMVAQVNLLTDPPYFAGQEVTYAITAINGGVNNATQVNLTPSMSNLTLLWAVGDHCNNPVCQITQLDFAQRENMTAQFVIDDVGPFNFGLSVSADEHDPVPANNSDANNGDVAGQGGNDLIFADDFD